MRLPTPLVNTAAALLFAMASPQGMPLLSVAPAVAALLPTQAELSRLPAGLARVDYLLGNWDRLTTVCGGISAGGELEDRQVMRTQNQNSCYKTPLSVEPLTLNPQVMRTQNQNSCYKTPLKVQKYIGASSTLDPLFKADKLMIKATPLVADEGQNEYGNAVDSYITKQQMSSTMAYTSSCASLLRSLFLCLHRLTGCVSAQVERGRESQRLGRAD